MSLYHSWLVNNRCEALDSNIKGISSDNQVLKSDYKVATTTVRDLKDFFSALRQSCLNFCDRFVFKQASPRLLTSSQSQRFSKIGLKSNYPNCFLSVQFPAKKVYLDKVFKVNIHMTWLSPAKANNLCNSVKSEPVRSECRHFLRKFQEIVPKRGIFLKTATKKCIWGFLTQIFKISIF